MRDLISRQSAIEAIEPTLKSILQGNSFKAINVMDKIRDLPSAQQWIPISERLPELDEAVLATTAWNDITIAWRIGISKWFIHEGNTNAETADILAWMPLPEGYKGEQE